MRALLLALILLVAWPAAAQDAPQDPLEAAYQLELTALRAELDSLRAERSRLEGEGAERVEALRVEVDGLRAALSRDQLAADLAEDHLAELELGAQGDSTRDETLAVTLEQAAVTLERHGIDLGDVEAIGDAELLRSCLAAADDLLDRRSRIRSEAGTFFLADGTEVSGTLVHLGEVATWGLVEGEAGPLVPGGGGALRLERPTTEVLAAWLDSGGLVDLYLLDPTTRGDEARVAGGVWEQIRAGGVLVWPILGLGALALLLGLERLFTLWRHSSRIDALLAKVLDLVGKGQISEATKVATRSRGAAARVLAMGLDHWHLDQERLEDVLTEAVSRELPRLERFLPILAVVAAVAPLLGLLGTVTGMISTFEVITEHGTGDPKMLSGGISVALVTTQLGLAVAIPVLLMHALLSGLVDRLVGDMTRAALTFNNVLHGVDFVRLPDGSWVPRGGAEDRDGPVRPVEGVGRQVLPTADEASLVPPELRKGGSP